MLVVQRVFHPSIFIMDERLLLFKVLKVISLLCYRVSSDEAITLNIYRLFCGDSS